MEDDEVEMTKEEFQDWIRDQLAKTMLLTPFIKEKYSLLESLLEKREEQTSNLLKICQSVAACEKAVKELYSLMEWEYKESDSEDNGEPTDCGHTQLFPEETSGHQAHCPPTSKRLSCQKSARKERDNRERTGTNGLQSPFALGRKAVVVLSKLSRSELKKALHPPSAVVEPSEDESLSSDESEMQWEPEEDTSESEFSLSDFSTDSNKKRKLSSDNKRKRSNRITCKRSNLAKDSNGPSSSSASTYSRTKGMKEHEVNQNSDPETNITKTTRATHQLTTTKTRAQSSSTTTTRPLSTTTKATTPQSKPKKTTTSQSNPTKTTTSQSNPTKTTTSQSNPKKTTTSQFNSAGVTRVNNQSSEATKTPPSKPQVELSVNMIVLARRKSLSWKLGRIAEVIRKKDGRIKYKVIFEKEKSLLSGHHIAFNCRPNIKDLFVGARVVVKHPVEDSQFMPGILVELPSRTNRMRFLVFIDDHTPMYIGLPLLHLVCQPLPDPLDDIPDKNHRHFIREYLKQWPYPQMTCYRVGNTINVEYNGFQQKCDVVVLDSSLMEIKFESDEHKEWIHRGSMRLEYHKLSTNEKHEAPAAKESSK